MAGPWPPRRGAALASCLAALALTAAGGCGGGSDDAPQARPGSERAAKRPGKPPARIDPRAFQTVANTVCGAIPDGSGAGPTISAATLERRIAALSQLPAPARLRPQVDHLLDELRRLLALYTTQTADQAARGADADLPQEREISEAEQRAALVAAAAGLPECFTPARAAP